MLFFVSDDIIFEKLILNDNHHIAKYNLDIIQFLSIHQKNPTIYANKYNFKYKNVIYQPISNYIFYYNDSGYDNNIVLWDKLTKKNYIKIPKIYWQKVYTNNICE